MYTILRLAKDRVSSNSARTLVNEMNSLLPEAKAEERPQGDGVSCEVSGSDDWSDHVDRIAWFAAALRTILNQAAEDGFRITFDVAVEPEDRETKLAVVLSFNKPLLQALVHADAELEVTVYSGAESQ